MAKNTSVLGIYPDRTSVANIVNVLHNAGFRATDISVLASDNEGSKDFALEKHNQALAGAATGAAACAVFGAVLAWFVSTQILPVAGLAPLVARQIFGAIRELNRRAGLTVLLVEQNAFQALRLAHRGYVLVNGAITMAGTGAELLARPEVRAAYLEGAHA